MKLKEIHGFMRFDGGCRFSMKRKLAKKLGLTKGDSFVVQICEEGIVLLDSRKYFNGEKFGTLLGIIKLLDSKISDALKTDDEILRNYFFKK